MKALTELHFQHVLRSTLSYPNETSKECIQFLNIAGMKSNLKYVLHGVVRIPMKWNLPHSDNMHQISPVFCSPSNVPNFHFRYIFKLNSISFHMDILVDIVGGSFSLDKLITEKSNKKVIISNV
jgi:hypothetical protein